MKKILVIGCPGSGKTTLSQKLSNLLQIPVVHLDRLFWRPHWQASPKEEFIRLLEVELDKEQWILDGNYNGTLAMRLERCDTVIFLDYPRRRCLYGACRRILLGFGKTRPDMGNDCPERFAPSFLRYIWNFRKQNRRKYLGMLHSQNVKKQIIILHNPKETEWFLEGLTSKQREQ